jgi:ribosome-binding protein aMBF1 (putative translation factor)
MLRIDRYLALLRERANARFPTKRALAKAAKIHHNTLLHLDNKQWSPSIETLRSLERILTGRRGSARP